jgi:DNA-binding Xre family transcriptional regulator
VLEVGLGGGLTMKLTRQEKLWHKVLGVVLCLMRHKICKGKDGSTFTQVRVAALANINVTNLSLIESTGKPFTLQTYFKVCEALGCRFEVMVSITEDICEELGDSFSHKKVEDLFNLKWEEWKDKWQKKEG